MSYEQDFYPESRFGGFTDVDGTIAFYTRVNELVDESDRLVDFGCGRGAYAEDEVETRRDLRNFKGRVREVVGLDVDPAAEVNPCIDEFHLLDGPTWPIEDESVDMVLSDYVLEHLEEPDVFFSEARRVLRTGGYLCVRTANKWSYPMIASRLIPDELHAKIVSVAQDGRHEEDVFPTVYECNTPGAIEMEFEKHAFDGIAYAYQPEPSYLEFSKFAYWLGVLHQKFAPDVFGPSLFGFARAA